MKKIINKKKVLRLFMIAVIGLVCIIPSIKANAATGPSMERLYRFYNGTDHFYARYSHYNEGGAAGYNNEGSLGMVYVRPYSYASSPIYRYYNGTDHFYTSNWSELGSGKDGYAYEGIEFYASQEYSYITQKPVYRYYNGTDHFYTTNYNELGSGANGYNFERVAFYIY